MTVLPASLVEPRRIRPTTQRINAANGTDIPVLGTGSVTARIGGEVIEIQGLVSEHVQEPMISLEWLTEIGATWFFAESMIMIRNKKYRLTNRQSKIASVRRVVLAEDTVVPPLTQCSVPAKVVVDGRAIFDSSQTHWATVRRESRRGLVVASSVIPENSFIARVRVANANEEPVTLNKGDELASLEPVTVLSEVGDTEPADAITPEAPKHVKDMLETVDDSVPIAEIIKLERLLNKYSAAISSGPTDMGFTDVVQHTIDTGDCPPMRQALRPIPIARRQPLDDVLSEQLAAGIIEPARSPYAVNLVLVAKHDGSIRACCDYRALNAATKRDTYPLPRMDQCLDALGDNTVFSTLDLRSGYHQVAMHPKDKEKTTFICHRGSFSFRTMPMGLVNAGATFQRLMDIVLSGLLFESCLAYLDDIIIFSKDVKTHLVHLERVLKRLMAYGLKLKPSKCTLLQRRVSFLGHIVSAAGIETDPSKTELISQWGVPTSVKGIRSFLGLCGYYRRFIKDYAEIASPLTNLQRKGVKFVWTEECQSAFNTLKKALTSHPVMAMPKATGRFILDTDASDHAIGAVLSQEQDDGSERVIAYASRVLQPSESQYCVTRREILAVVVFLARFRQYLLGQPDFLVRTDNSAVSWLQRTPQPVGQSARWLAQLQEYKFTIEHRAGTKHGNADAMSRRPCTRPNMCVFCQPDAVQCRAVNATRQSPDVTTPSVEDFWNKDALKEAQVQDTEIGPVYAALEQSADKPPPNQTSLWSEATKILLNAWPRLKLIDEILYRRWEDPDGVRISWQLVVPDKYRQEAFERAHTGMTGGHLGLTKTQDQICRRMYWPTWKTDSKMWIRRCNPCAQYHRGSAPKQTPLNPFPAGSPFELMSMDITGPHPRSRDGNEYILTIVDSFTKWADAFPIRTHTAQVVARKLVDGVFTRVGTPLRLLSDQGPEFESALMTELCRVYQIEKIRTTSYRPSTNGAVERFHRTLNSMLGKVVADSQKDWDRRLCEVMAAYRSTVHEATGFSPNFLVHGRELRAPIDVVLAVSDEPEGVGVSTDDYANELVQRQRKAYDVARRHLGKAAERRKREYDHNVRTRTFKTGTWVWYFYPRRYRGKSPKWSRHYTGPYLIVREIPPCDVVLQKSARSKAFVAHVDKLKTFYGDPPLSWIDDVASTPVVGDRPCENTNVVDDVQAPSPKRPAMNNKYSAPRTGSDPVIDDDRSPPARSLRDRNRIARPGRFRN